MTTLLTAIPLVFTIRYMTTAWSQWNVKRAGQQLINQDQTPLVLLNCLEGPKLKGEGDHMKEPRAQR